MLLQDIVSIIIPARKIDYLLENSIAEIRKQYPLIKIYLILDTISADDYKKTDKSIYLLKAEKYTMSAKRNQAVKVASSKYAALIDSDAYPDSNWLETGINFLEEHAEYSAVTGCQLNNPNDSFYQKCLRLLRFSPLFSHKEWQKIIDFDTEDTDCEEFMTSNVIINRDTYLALNGMNEDIYLAEDNEFSSRMNQSGYKIRFISKMRVFHRESETIPFLLKFLSISKYYAKCFVTKQNLKSNSKTFSQFLPFIAGILYLILFGVQVFWVKLPILCSILLFLPILVFVLLLWNSCTIARKLKNNYFKGVVFLFFVSILFCFVWVLGTALGLINLKYLDETKYYKHY